MTIPLGVTVEKWLYNSNIHGSNPATATFWGNFFLVQGKPFCTQKKISQKKVAIAGFDPWAFRLHGHFSTVTPSEIFDIH
jgi:hypothetical protein